MKRLAGVTLATILVLTGCDDNSKQATRPSTQSTTQITELPLIKGTIRRFHFTTKEDRELDYNNQKILYRVPVKDGEPVSVEGYTIPERYKLNSDGSTYSDVKPITNQTEKEEIKERIIRKEIRNLIMEGETEREVAERKFKERKFKERKFKFW